MSSFELNLSGEFFTFRFVALANNREGKVKKKLEKSYKFTK